ncbi:MAG: hypothetical protein HUU34_08935 [Saprospiraceae bacterium]|jgi:hypothetical protein|nr:hypothetical protein [Saprospiraceae bacterium]
MKILMMTMLAAVMMWCAGPEKKAPDKHSNQGTTTYQGIDTLILPNAKDNIRFLQRAGEKLIYDQSWSGPLIAATFHHPASGILLKTINIRDRNPYLNIGFNIEHFDGDESSDVIRIHSDKARHKSKIRTYLPQYLYDEIPDDWMFSGGITMCMLGSNWAKEDSYIPVYYLLEWAPEDERDFMGNYGVTMVTVFDSTGTEVYRRQFDGLLTDAVVSDDGKYLAITYTLYPETGNDSIPRLRNYAELIYIPDNKSVWKDSTPLHYEKYNFQTYRLNALVGAKYKEREDSYLFLIIDTAKDKLYFKNLDGREEMRGIIAIKNDKMLYRTTSGFQEMTISNNFQTKNLLDK